MRLFALFRVKNALHEVRFSLKVFYEALNVSKLVLTLEPPLFAPTTRENPNLISLL